MLTEKLLNTVLQDDGSEDGGVSFIGQTLKDFLEEIEEDYRKLTLEDANEILVDCGIMPIKEV